MVRKSGSDRFNRRAFIKASAATGAALAAGSVFAPAVRAAKTVKFGYVSPQTGPLAAFAEANNFIISNFQSAVKDGIKVGNATYPVEVVVKDSQSNPNRAAEVAKELIVGDKVDLMLAASTPETTNPVSTQCEIEEMPCVTTMCPWQAYFIGRQGNPAGGPPAWKPFNYTYHYFWGLEDVIAVFTNMWGQLKTDKVVGALFPNDGDGNTWGDKVDGFPPGLDKLGYKLVDPGRYQNLTDDFTAQIVAFKKAECDIITGVVLPPDFTTFWNQALQQGLKPKIASVGKAILFPSAVEALGKNGNNLSSEVWWTPHHPFKSSLTGQSAQALSDAYEKSSRKQWTQPIGFVHSLFEVAVDVMNAHRTLATTRPSSSQSHRPSWIPWSGRSPGMARTCRHSPRRTSPRRRSLAVSGAIAKATSTTSSSLITKPSLQSQSAARCNRLRKPKIAASFRCTLFLSEG